MSRRYAEPLIRDGLFASQQDLDSHAADLVAFDANPSNARFAWRFGVGEAITDTRIKLAEIRNWLERQVLR
jgi:GMP synthase (glutamine-hydrolysing)